MAVRNCEQYVRASVASLARQYFTSFETIIVDDGSTDGTSETLAELINANPSLSIVSNRNVEALGIAASRNRALALTESEYIAVLDGDDLCRADRLAQQAAFLDANPRCFCVASTAMSISAEGAPQEIMDYGVRSHEQVVEQLLAGLNPIINSSAMFRRREAVETLGGYKTEGPAAIVEDLDFWYRAVLAGLRFHVLPDPLVFYRSNPAGHTYTRNQEIRQAHEVRLGEFRREFERRRRPADFGLDRKSKIENLKCDGPHPNPLPEGEGTLRAPGRLLRRPSGGPIRAAFLTPVLHLGGAEQWILSLLKRCDPSRLRWTGVALADCAPVHAGFCREVAAHAPIYGPGSVHCESVIRCATPRDALCAAASDADVLVVWGSWNIRPVLEAVGIPVVYVLHGEGAWSTNCARAIEKEPVRLAAVSEAARSAFSAKVRHRVRVIHNGIEVDRCAPNRSRESVRAGWGFDAGDRLAGYAGRYSGEKNPAAAALAVSRLPEQFRAVYAGSGLHEAAVRAIVEKIAGERAVFVPADRRVGNSMQAFDVVVTASPAEGFSLLVAEAWYCGVPVVATRVGAIPELEAVHGELVAAVPIAPTAEELASAVERALSAEFRRQVVPRARALVAERFTATRMAERWTDYLIEICAERSRCAGPSS